MDVTLLTQNGSTEKLQVSDAIFSREFNESLIHQIIVAYQANARGGNRAQKGRSEIAKSTRKPWRQKGTGRARAGMASSPLWRGGGKIFPNSPEENFSHKVNKKMYRAGMRSIFSQLVREDRLKIIDDIVLDSPKTKLLDQKLKQLGVEDVLLISHQVNDNLLLASRNLVNVMVIESSHVDPLSLVNYKNILITKDAVAHIQELFA